MSMFRDRLKTLSLSRIFDTSDEKPAVADQPRLPVAPRKPAPVSKKALPVVIANDQGHVPVVAPVAASPQRKADAAKPKAQDKPRKRVPPVSIRFTADERARLEREAAGMSLSGHIRERLFAGKAVPRKTRGRFPVKDHQALARVLSALGRSKLYNSLSCLVLAVEESRCALDASLERDLREALQHVTLLRSDLVAALGLKPK